MLCEIITKLSIRHVPEKRGKGCVSEEGLHKNKVQTRDQCRVVERADQFALGKPAHFSSETVVIVRSSKLIVARCLKCESLL